MKRKYDSLIYFADSFVYWYFKITGGVHTHPVMCMDSHRKLFIIFFWSWHPLRHILGPAADAEQVVQPLRGASLEHRSDALKSAAWGAGGRKLGLPSSSNERRREKLLCSQHDPAWVPTAPGKEHRCKALFREAHCRHGGTEGPFGEAHSQSSSTYRLRHSLQGGSCDTDIMLLCLLPSLPLSESTSPIRSCICWRDGDAPCTRLGWQLQEFACQSTPASAEVSAGQMLPKYTGSEWLS